MLYRRRMERQLAQARGLMSGEGKMPPPEDDVSHLYIRSTSLPSLNFFSEQARMLKIAGVVGGPAPSSNPISLLGRTTSGHLRGCLSQRRRQDDLQYVTLAMSGAATHVGRGRRPAPGRKQARRLRAAQQAWRRLRGRQHAPPRGELCARHQPVRRHPRG